MLCSVPLSVKHTRHGVLEEQGRLGRAPATGLGLSSALHPGLGPSEATSALLLSLLPSQLVNLRGTIHVGDGGGELELFPAVDSQVTIGLVFTVVLV